MGDTENKAKDPTIEITLDDFGPELFGVMPEGPRRYEISGPIESLSINGKQVCGPGIATIIYDDSITR